MAEVTQPTEQPRVATHSFDGVILASLITTLLAPLFAYMAIFLVAEGSFLGAALGLYVAPFFPMVAPLAFGFIFLMSATLGWLLSFFAIRHIAFFMLAGAVVGPIAWALEPMLIWGDGPLFLSKETDFAGVLAMMAGMAGGGAINGAIYWWLARRFSRART
jgi:hypothetical protein